MLKTITLSVMALSLIILAILTTLNYTTTLAIMLSTDGIFTMGFYHFIYIKPKIKQ